MSMTGYPTGTVTFLFTDIERSTSLWERDAAAARVVVDRHIAIIRQAVAAHGGVHYKTVGDATQSAFATAPQGVRAALDAQRGLVVEPWSSPDDRPRVRMALHAGAAEPRDGDYLAGCLNRLARLLDAAHGEQILISHTVAGLTHDELPAGASLDPLGEFRLRDILQPEAIFQLRHPALRADFPPLNTPGDIPHNLPAHPTPFLGREREIEEIVALLQRSDVRLVTLTGPGGVGKTRLGLRVAAEALESFPDGAFVIDLARLTDPDLIPSATATALGLREQAGQPLPATLADYLRDRRILLLFDNFEHVLPAATLVADLLLAAPHLKVLATSRARLGLQAEREYRVETLPIPDPRALPPLEQLAQYDAIALFVARAQALRPGFALTRNNAPAVGEIVCKLDGLPLAIELAAARIKLLSPEALRDRLDRRLVTLTGGARDLPARQRTLRDTIAWSHDLLAPGEQILLRRLSVFAGGWTLEGAEAVCAVDDVEAIEPLQGLSGLVDQSLVDERPGHGAEDDAPRYGMLETIREFAREQLTASGEVDAVERAFEAFLFRLAEEAQEGLRGAQQERWLARLDAEHDNLRAALGRAIERGGDMAALELSTRLWRFWWTHGHLGEGRSWLARALSTSSQADPRLRARAEFGLGELSLFAGDYTAADEHYEAYIALVRDLGDKRAMADGLNSRANVAINLRKYAEARTLGEEALQVGREHGDVRGIGGALYELGLVARGQGDYERARQLFEESMAAWLELDDLAWMATVAMALGITHRLERNPGKARPRLRDANDLYRRLGERSGAATVALEFGHLAREAGDIAQAIVCYGEALRYFDSIGYSELVVYCIEYLAAAKAAHHDAEIALHLFGAAETARTTLRLPPVGESDARIVENGLAQATQAAGSDAERLLESGRALTFDQARDEAIRLIGTVAAGTSPPCGADSDRA
jgi:predicted ATPase/class 3 adenylate cyclase